MANESDAFSLYFSKLTVVTIHLINLSIVALFLSAFLRTIRVICIKSQNEPDRKSCLLIRKMSSRTSLAVHTPALRSCNSLCSENMFVLRLNVSRAFCIFSERSVHGLDVLNVFANPRPNRIHTRSQVPEAGFVLSLVL